MKIEVGKFYKTRNGRKARIYAVDGTDEYPIHGAILDRTDGWCIYVWRNDGGNLPSQPYHSDLISEWTDRPEVDWSAMPKWAEWYAIDGNGIPRWFNGRMPSIKDDIWVNYELWGVVPFEYAPKWSGDWKDSLVKRPE